MSSSFHTNIIQIPEISRSFLIKTVVKGVSARRNFGKEEDIRLFYLVQIYGTKNWNLIASMMPFRNVRQCRDRFMNYLSPKINLKPWTKEEDILLMQKFNEVGPKWVYISQFFEGRSDNNLKNRYYTHLKPKYNNFKKNQKDPQILEQNQNKKEIQIFEDNDHLFLDDESFYNYYDQQYLDCSLII